MIRFRHKIMLEACKKDAKRMEADPHIWEYHQWVQEKTRLLHKRIVDMLQVAEKEEWTALRFIMEHERELMEYYDRRGQYGWDTLSYGDLVIRHGQYYEMDKEEEEQFRMQVQNDKFKPTAMGSKMATKAFRKQMDIYLEAHGGDDGIMAPCGCVLTREWTAQGREMDESPKEEEGHGECQGGLGGHGGGKGSGKKDPDWDSPAEGIKAGKGEGKEPEGEEQVWQGGWKRFW